MKVIPDSSFFICFLDDLEGHLPIDDRIRILMVITSNFTIMVVPEVEQESRFHRIPQTIRDQVRLVKIPAFGQQSDPAIELLRPLVGKGEHEVITCAYVHFLNDGKIFLFILDDGVARDLVKRLLPALVNHMKGTAGFLGYCAIQKVLEKDEVIDFLKALGMSKFRIDPSIITSVIAEVQNRC